MNSSLLTEHEKITREEMVALLNDLMRLTDTSLLPRAAGSPLIASVDDRPRERGEADWFAPAVRRRVRLLGGFA